MFNSCVTNYQRLSVLNLGVHILFSVKPKCAGVQASCNFRNKEQADMEWT